MTALFLKGIVFLIFSLAQADAECNSSRIFQALSGCHMQRLMLSDASETVNENNYLQLCKKANFHERPNDNILVNIRKGKALEQQMRAFLNYVQCLEPGIARCKGTALLGFNIIKKTYTRDPYYCQVESEPESTTEIIIEEHNSTTKSLAPINKITSSLHLAVIQGVLLYLTLFCKCISLE